MINGKIHYKWPFSIATLNYQRVVNEKTNRRWGYVGMFSHGPRANGQVLQLRFDGASSGCVTEEKEPHVRHDHCKACSYETDRSEKSIEI